jgi:putative spermidine/putrescine transport system substrate-binding protein
MQHRVLRRTVLGAVAAALSLIMARSGAAAERSLQIGIYSAQQGEYVRKTIIPQFETDFGCKVCATEGFTLSQIAALRATKDNPRCFSAMFMDDLGVEIAKREGLIEQLPADKILNMARVIKRFIFFDGYGAGFAISTVGLVINPQSIKPLASYGMRASATAT